MKPFTGGATNALEGRELIPRTFSRRQALGLLGGSLAGASLLSLGLAAPAKAAEAGIVGPRGNPRPELSAKRVGNWWDLTLEWTCVFAPGVVNHRFGTNWTLMEADDYGHDVVSATVEPHPHSATSATKAFVPSQANPSNPKAVNFTQTIGWHQDDLDTELGGEELFAIVRLRDFTLGTSSFIRYTETLDLAP